MTQLVLAETTTSGHSITNGGQSSETSRSATNIPDDVIPIPVFVVLGKTGAGKSSFIKSLGALDERGKEPVVSRGIDSCTKDTISYTTRIADQEITLLDTPGFCDSRLTTYHILEEIIPKLDWIARNKTFQTQGVIFLHDINGIRFDESQEKTLEILKAICGTGCLGNVIIGTTRWTDKNSRPEDFSDQENSEQQYLSNHWRGIHKTVRVQRDDKAVAVEILEALLELHPITLQAQAEMKAQKLQPGLIGNITAGRLALGNCGEEIRAIIQGLARDREELSRAQEKLEGDSQKLTEDMSEFGGSVAKLAEAMKRLTRLAADGTGLTGEGVELTKKARTLEEGLDVQIQVLEDKIGALEVQQVTPKLHSAVKETQMGVDETTRLLQPSDESGNGNGDSEKHIKPGRFQQFLGWIKKKWGELMVKLHKLVSRQKERPMCGRDLSCMNEKGTYRSL